MSEGGISIGERAPELRLPDTGGESHRLSATAERAATVVYWTCNHCPYALAWHDRLLDVARDYGDRGVRFLAINSNDAERYPADSPQAMRERVEREGGWPHPYLHDESQEVARGVRRAGTPDVFVFDAGPARCATAARRTPTTRTRRRTLPGCAAALDAVLAGGSAEPAETEPVGCSIKWKG